MITDTLGQSHRYLGLSPFFPAAFEFLKNLPATQPLGRFDIAGDACFALVQSYPTKPADQLQFEAHKKYTDIQFISAGRETLLWTPLSDLKTVAKPYNETQDVAFFEAPARFTPVRLSAGQFAIFFPEDGHAPCLECDGPATVRKVVIKIRA